MVMVIAIHKEGFILFYPVNPVKVFERRSHDETWHPFPHTCTKDENVPLADNSCFTLGIIKL
jgi:hypothetical protein